MHLGYQRPLQATDLWKVDESREADHLSTRFLAALKKRQQQAAAWNEALPTAKPDWRTLVKWSTTAAIKRKLPPQYAKYGSDATFAARRATLEAEWREHSGRRQGSITWALSEVFPDFWVGGECCDYNMVSVCISSTQGYSGSSRTLLPSWLPWS
jgi:hypothetical protein